MYVVYTYWTQYKNRSNNIFVSFGTYKVPPGTGQYLGVFLPASKVAVLGIGYIQSYITIGHNLNYMMYMYVYT